MSYLLIDHQLYNGLQKIDSSIISDHVQQRQKRHLKILEIKQVMQLLVIISDSLNLSVSFYFNILLFDPVPYIRA